MADSLEARLAALEVQVRTIDDIRAVEDVLQAWNNTCTGGFEGIGTHRVEEAVALFTKDGSIEARDLTARGGAPVGHDELREYLGAYEGEDSLIPRVFQMTTNHVTTVDGDTAHQTSDLICAMVMKGEPVIFFGTYVNDFVRTADGWRIKKIRMTPAFRVPVDDIAVAAANPDWLDSGFVRSATT
jgi:hypothetical protein